MNRDRIRRSKYSKSLSRKIFEHSSDPSKSQLVLNDWQTSPLTVSELVAMNIRLAQFAYLSACHTAGSRDIRLLSESINLSSAVQLAGFPSVIGTLWTVDDAPSSEISTNVYQGMLVDNKLDIGRSAEGLHCAALAQFQDSQERFQTIP